MIEYSITQSLLQVVLQHADGRKVLAVDLLIGEVSSYVDDSIQFYWDELAKGTPAEGAVLRFQREPGTLKCLACGKEFSIHEPDFICPACGGLRSEPGRGRQCRVESIDVEEETP